MGAKIGAPPVITPGPVRDDFIRNDANLDEHQKKYCRCLLKVQAKSSSARSPYGICTKSTGSQVHSCSDYYDWSAMDLPMLIAYLELHKISTAGINSREQALEAIRQWKVGRGEHF